MPGNFESLPFSVSVKPSELHKYGGNAGANCYLTMPFNKRARIEIENQGENAYIQVRPALCDNPEQAVLLHRLRTLQRPFAQRHPILPLNVATRESYRRLGSAEFPDQFFRDTSQESRWKGQLCHLGDRR